jgi:hypothetical protein
LHNLFPVQFTVRTIFNIFNARTADRKVGSTDKTLETVILPCSPFGIYQEAESLIKGEFGYCIVLNLLPVLGSHGRQLHLM